MPHIINLNHEFFAKSAFLELCEEETFKILPFEDKTFIVEYLIASNKSEAKLSLFLSKSIEFSKGVIGGYFLTMFKN